MPYIETCGTSGHGIGKPIISTFMKISDCYLFLLEKLFDKAFMEIEANDPLRLSDVDTCNYQCYRRNRNKYGAADETRGQRNEYFHDYCTVS